MADITEKDAEPTSVAEVPYEAEPLPRKVHWFRGTLFQTLVVGWASFLAPGMYAALASTGAGGLANVSRRFEFSLMPGRHRKRKCRSRLRPDCAFCSYCK
jgi:hypothetical protein